MDTCTPTISGDGRINCDIRQLNTGFVEALEDLPSVIKKRFHDVPNVWRNRIKRGAYELGHTLEKSIITHHAGMGDQAGLDKWEQIKVSDPDEDFDACKYQAHVVDSGFSRVSYTGFHTERRTKDICLNDVKWQWQYEQQVAAYFSFLSDVTARIWETWGRENYMMFCTSYVLSDGGADSIEVDYNPRASANIVLPNVKMSTLKWDYLQWYHQMLALECPMAALGHDAGFPLFGLVMHPIDWHHMIENDEKLRQTYNEAAPQTLLDHYGSAPTFKGFMIIGDMEAPRWRIDGRDAAGDLECTRVEPYVQKKVTKGVKWVANPEYVNAEIAYGTILLNDVFNTLVPPSGPSKVAGLEFGAVPGLMGEFFWLNIQDRETNMLKERGFYFSRFQAFAEPGDYHADPIGFFYKRCTAVDAVVCDTPDGVSTATAVTALFSATTFSGGKDGGETITVDGEKTLIADGGFGFIGVSSIGTKAGENITIRIAMGDEVTASVVLVSEDGKTIVVEDTVATSANTTGATVRVEGPNELRLVLADALAGPIGADVIVTKDTASGGATVNGIIGKKIGVSTYVIAFKAGETPAFADMGAGATVDVV